MERINNAIMKFLMHGHLQSMLLTLPRDGQVVVYVNDCVLDIKLIVISLSNVRLTSFFPRSIPFLNK
jgi:hypothetical protein